jgi:hypothetical protein
MSKLHTKMFDQFPINECNKSIAEFLGWKVYDNGHGTLFFGHIDMFNPEDFECTEGELQDMFNDGHLDAWFYHEDRVEFNTSWDWLIPVVSKIETMELSRESTIRHFHVKIEDNKCTILKEYNPDYNHAISVMLSHQVGTYHEYISDPERCKQKAVYYTVCKFIELYNDSDIK